MNKFYSVHEFYQFISIGEPICHYHKAGEVDGYPLYKSTRGWLTGRREVDFATLEEAQEYCKKMANTTLEIRLNEQGKQLFWEIYEITVYDETTDFTIVERGFFQNIKLI